MDLKPDSVDTAARVEKLCDAPSIEIGSISKLFDALEQFLLRRDGDRLRLNAYAFNDIARRKLTGQQLSPDQSQSEFRASGKRLRLHRWTTPSDSTSAD